MSKSIKVGIVGANWSLKVHGTAWRMLPGVELAAVCTAHKETAEAAAQAFGIPKAYWNVEKWPPTPTSISSTWVAGPPTVMKW